MTKNESEAPPAKARGASRLVRLKTLPNVPRMLFEEAEGMTLILLQSEAERQGMDCEFPCRMRMITLNIHSSLDAVGFLARITTALAHQEMGVNPVSGFFHDHLFVPDGREMDA